MSSRPSVECQSVECPSTKKAKISEITEKDEYSPDESEDNSSDNELCLRAVPITMPLKPALQRAAEFVETFTRKWNQNPNCEKEDPEWDEISSWGVSTQGAIYDACPHTDDDGVYDCVCHEIGDAIGNLSQEPSLRDDVITSKYLGWLNDLIAETLMELP
jgi:hypothetical protein